MNRKQSKPTTIKLLALTRVKSQQIDNTKQQLKTSVTEEGRSLIALSIRVSL